jgi:hypothetical protein
MSKTEEEVLRKRRENGWTHTTPEELRRLMESPERRKLKQTLAYIGFFLLALIMFVMYAWQGKETPSSIPEQQPLEPNAFLLLFTVGVQSGRWPTSQSPTKE